ncbi:MAG: hypothetical protein ACLVK4_14840 [Alistipes shahii]|uniref:hypothetical protein n=1 Tax=Alistipes shahii TaxID=328814 RepID=UPI00399CF87A
MRRASDVAPPKRIAEASTAFSYSSREWIMQVISSASRFWSTRRWGSGVVLGDEALDGFAVEQQ